MSRKFLFLRILSAIILLSGGVVSAASSTSAAPATPSGITISPPVQQVLFPVSETSVPLSVDITNNTPSPQTLNLSTVDFNALQDTGGLLFIGSKATALQRKYGLAKWLQLPYQQMTLSPGQTQAVKATIRNDSTLAGGGHYGAILFTQRSQPNGTGVSANLNAVASALVFAEKQGGIIYKLSLQAPHFGTYWSSLPSSVTLRFHNEGNVHLVPRGKISITSPLGKVVANGIINEDSAILLPQNVRDYKVQLDRSLGSLVPGRYKVSVLYRYDGNDTFTELDSSSWVINLEGILLVLIAFVIAVLALVKRRSIVRFFQKAGRRIARHGRRTGR